jgi:hypothetical protein
VHRAAAWVAWAAWICNSTGARGRAARADGLQIEKRASARFFYPGGCRRIQPFPSEAHRVKDLMATTVSLR